MTTIRVLPRSLAPLPDESITGFLLRLAHRLDTSPARLMAVTGLHPDGAGPASRGPSPFVLLTQVDAQALRNFAQATRLTDAEAAGLLLGGYAERYPPAAPRPDATGRRGARLHLDQWVWSKSTRYGPTCLAGDGSPLQTRHGGAWRRAWRLPVVFTCPVHRRYLDHRCPACDHLVHHRVVGFPARWWSTDLHPTQCRATHHPAPTGGAAQPGCEAFLTTAPGVRLRPATAVLTTQQRLLDALTATTDVVECLGRPASPGHYFTDLIQLSYLLRRSWPLGRDLVPTAVLAQALEEYIVGRHEHIADQCRRIGGDAGRQLHNEDRAPPVDSVACAALLATADRLLTLDTPRALTSHLRHLLSHDPRRPGKADWTRQFLTERPDSSEGLRQAVAPILQTYARTRRARSLNAPIRRTPFGPEHIAQFLHRDWYQRHLAGLDGINPTHLRRTAALHLCQMAVGGSIRQAAQRLGLPDTTATVERCHSSARAVHRWAKQRQDPYEFETAVHNLADELEASPHRIDYHQRRAALDEWCIDADTWAQLVAQLSDSPWPHRRELELGDRKRHCASTIVWARITGGEHLFAPHPLRDRQPAGMRNAWRLSSYSYALVARFP